MMSDRIANLRARAQRAFPTGDIPGSLGKTRAIVGVPHIPDSEAAAQRALEALRRGEIPPPGELAALEFVIRLMRQAPLSRQGELAPLAVGAAPHLFDPSLVEAWDGFRARVKPLLYSIGRIDLNDGRTGAVGTGFVATPGLVLTNRHVLAALSGGTEVLERGQATVRFHQEFGSVDPPGATVAITGVAGVHPRLDMALLRIDDPVGRPALPLRPAPAEPSAAVATVGYPLEDPLRNPIFAPAIFGTRYGVKRAAVGEIMERDGATVFHDCSTLGGNSGSPVFTLADGAVAAVHASGFFMYRNSAIDVTEIAPFLESVR